jgi:hypothetical protein
MNEQEIIEEGEKVIKEAEDIIQQTEQYLKWSWVEDIFIGFVGGLIGSILSSLF